ncbi:MAG TPA: penicillin-binding protein 2 [Dehalococcoidia bacterium]|nr:penicillin-binding protein 2 [Dehalococcoidia bacterium]
MALRALVIAMFLILVGQLVRLQVVESGQFKERAAINAIREVNTAPARGLVYDREGRPLVQNVARYSAAIVPADLPKRGEIGVYRQLAPVLGMSEQEIQSKVNEQVARTKDELTPVVLKEDLSADTAMVLRELEPHTQGVHLLVQPTRNYLYGALTSQIMGYVGALTPEDYEQLKAQGYQLQDRVGQAGIESVYESLLRGKVGKQLVEVNSAGREQRIIAEHPGQDGDNLILTIDLDLQKMLRDVLAEKAAGSDNAAAAIMDVHTGEVLAMVSLPEYDDNVFSRNIKPEELTQLVNAPGKPLLNHAIAEMYPPGSTFKTITGSAALQEGVATTATTITSRGYITVQNEFDPNVLYRFNDYAALGTMDFYRGLALSSDVYFYYLAGGKADEGFVGLGADRLARYARAFGLGQETGIDLPGESAGIVPDPAWKEKTIDEPWVLGDTYNMGIGQGYVTTTPIQMLVVAATVANGGKVLQPHLLKEVRDPQGNVIQSAKTVVKSQVPVDERYLKVITEGMVQSVSSGVARTAAVRGLNVAGKTGTAEFGLQRADSTYSTHGWFIGFAPAGNPQYAIVVFVERGGGGAQAAPVASSALDFMFNGSDLAARLERNP